MYLTKQCPNYESHPTLLLMLSPSHLLFACLCGRHYTITYLCATLPYVYIWTNHKFSFSFSFFRFRSRLASWLYVCVYHLDLSTLAHLKTKRNHKSLLSLEVQWNLFNDLPTLKGQHQPTSASPLPVEKVASAECRSHINYCTLHSCTVLEWGACDQVSTSKHSV